MSFPVPGTLMVEPTESENLEELNRFCEAMIEIRAEIARVESGEWPRDDNPLVGAPHTAEELAGDWPHSYSRQVAAFPLERLRAENGWTKYFSPVKRLDLARGDRNPVCSCPPIGGVHEDLGGAHDGRAGAGESVAPPPSARRRARTARGPVRGVRRLAAPDALRQRSSRAPRDEVAGGALRSQPHGRDPRRGPTARPWRSIESPPSTSDLRVAVGRARRYCFLLQRTPAACSTTSSSTDSARTIACSSSRTPPTARVAESP